MNVEPESDRLSQLEKQVSQLRIQQRIHTGFLMLLLVWAMYTL